MPGLRSRKSRANVVAHPIPTFAILNAGEYIKASLEPIGPSLRDLKRLVLGVIRRSHAVDDLLGAVDSKVGVNLHHRHILRRRLRGEDLNFLVILGATR